MPSRVRFGLFQFDPATGELSREGTPIRLQPQPARVLALLLERPGELVSREDLRRHVWGNETFVDFERGLNFCIAQIRSALGDSADSPRYVETVPKRGYRFIAPAAVDGTGPPNETRPPKNNKRATGIALAASLVAAVGAFIFVRQQVTEPAATVPIAVVPFDNQTGSIAFDAVAEGLADATVAQLAQADRPRLAVVGNAQLLRTARSFRDVKRIGAELNVDYVVLGQVQRDGQGVRVVAHLIRVSDERHVWANRFDRPELTLAVQGEIADRIAREVARLLQPSE
ncbi:MAG TPA: winged helix-turn-helix domain-containing protein [Vicinamibacterales bacterium]|jgi:DNA-binding winged helix-turn-helix (wHTH) protein|nr:winged helix-turn-helix domain-containing protein [Vicinamibacterales bacterium]